MPGAEDKVVLKVMIDIADSKKEFKGLDDVLKKVAKESTRMTSASDKAIKEQMRSVQDLGKAHKAATNAAVQGEKKKQQEIAKTTKAQKEAASEAKKSMGMFEKMGKKVAELHKKGQLGAPTLGKGARAVGRGAKGVIGAGLSLGGGLLGFMTGGMSQAFNVWQQYHAARFGLTGMGASPRGMSRAVGKGTGLGFTPMETVAQAPGVGRAVGRAESVTLAQQLALGGGGMQVGEATGIMAALRQAGVTYGGMARQGGSTEQKMFRQQRQGAKELSRLVEGGLISGLERARLPEYLQGVSQIAEEVGGRQAGRVNVRDIGATMGLLGQIPGMQGRRGMNLARQLDQAIRAPGGGEAGQQLVLQSLGFGKPGGGQSYYKAVRQQQRGLFGEGGAETAINLLSEITKQYGVEGVGGKNPLMEEANLVASQQLGLTIDQVEAMQEVANSGKDQKEKLAKIREQMEKAQPIEKQALNASKEGFAGVKKRLAGIQATNIKIGGKGAKLMMKIQDYQLKALDHMTNYFPQMIDLLKQIAEGIKALVGKLVGKTGAEEYKRLGPSQLGAKGGMVKFALRPGMDPGSIIGAAEQNLKTLGQMQAQRQNLPSDLRKRGDFLDRYMEGWRRRWLGKGVGLAEAQQKAMAEITKQQNYWNRIKAMGIRARMAGVKEVEKPALEAMRKAAERRKVLSGEFFKKKEEEYKPEWLSRKRKPTTRKGRRVEPEPTTEQPQPGTTVPAGRRTIKVVVPVAEPRKRRLQGTPISD